MTFRRRFRPQSVAPRESQAPRAIEDAGSTEELLAQIDSLTAEARREPDVDLECRIRSLRHVAGLRLADGSGAAREHIAPDFDRLPDGSPLPEIGPDQLTPPLLRGAILRHGCLLVRGLVGDADVARLVDGIDRSFESREAKVAGRAADRAYYDEFVPDPRFDLSVDRQWIGGDSNFWAVDSPRVMSDLFALFDRSNLRQVASEYLGERPAISVNKSTLRRVYPRDYEGDVQSAWHQDGAFLQDVRALNLWLALTRCGDLAPGLDIVPQRLDGLVSTGTEGATFDWSVSQQVAEEEAADVGIMRPVFEPGDALLFDDLFLHATAANSEMPNTRYAVECWFFGPSSFPSDYPPLAA